MALTTGRILTVGCAAAGLALLGVAAWLGSLETWAEPDPDVDLTPPRPALREADVLPNSALDFLRRAAALPETVAVFDFDKVAAKVRLRGLPPELPTPGTASSAAASEQTHSVAADRSTAPVLPGDAGGSGKVLFRTETEAAVPRRPAFDPALPWTDAELRAVADALAAIRPHIDLAHRAADAPDPQAVVPETTGGEDFDLLEGVRRLGAALTLSAAVRADRGDLTGALADLSAAVRCGGILSTGGPIINHFVEIGVTGTVMRSLWDLTVSRDLPPEGAHRLIGDLARVEGRIDSPADALRYEALLVGEHAALLYSGGHDTLARALGGLSGPSRSERMLAVAIWGTRRLTGSTETGTRRNLRAVYTRLIGALEQPYGPGALAAAAAPFDSPPTAGRLLRVRDPVGYLCASLLTAVPQEPGLRKAEERNLHLRLGRAYLATKLFRQDTGRLPRGPDELVPGYLDAVPGDPFDGGRPVRLRVDPDGTWVVYSVGPDGIDHGGDAGGAMALWSDPLPPPAAGHSNGVAEPADADARRSAPRRYADAGYAGQRETPPPAGFAESGAQTVPGGD